MTRPSLPRPPRRLVLAAACAVLGVGLLAALPNVTTAEAASARAKKKRLLVVTVTKGFRHGDSIPVAEKTLAEMGESSGKFTVDYVRTDEEMAQKMTAKGLKNYDGVLFASTTGELPLPDRDAFLKWIADGHAFMGTHAATDTFHKWPAYLDMIGAHFMTHGPQVSVTCLNEDKKHPATKMLGDSQEVYDEIYQFKEFDRTKFHGLLALNQHPNNKTPGDYPIAWCKNYGKGRVFYTALGHRPDVWAKPWYQAHLMGGMLWAMGLERGDAKPHPALFGQIPPAAAATTESK